jgi:lipopolysaccharide assembly outer membrane protein LptD (OstA)
MAIALSAQTPDIQVQQDPEAALSAMSDLERKTLSLSIAVSMYYELRAMAARYGVETAGTAEDLRKRLYAFFKLSEPVKPPTSSTVTIENASSFEYFSIEGSEGSIVRLSGPIRLTLVTGDAVTHVISADEILFDKDANVVSALGNVSYSRKGEGRTDEFFGSKIIIDLDDYAGVFIDGSYDMEPSGSLQRTMSFAFENLTRRGSELTILEGARITACDEIPPHYHIRARKVWLFENGDWALSGATLYLGVVPVLWLPFFYYPSDEIIFHPVLGFRSREGSFVQTTSYLIGEKKSGTTESSSLSMLEQRSSTQKRIQGIFIQRMQSGTEASAALNTRTDGSGITTLKLLADIYSSLGVFVGVEGTIATPALTSLDFSLGFGLSRSIFLQSNGYYSPFDYSNSYESFWNSSNFLGLELPLRYGMSFKYKTQKSSGSLRYTLAIDIPLFSDPYFEQDFYQRGESSSILSAFTTKTTAVAKRTSMSQAVQSSVQWSAPATLKTPLVATVNFSKISARAIWNSKSQSSTGMTSAERRRLSVDPQREFFYPDSLKIIDSSVNVSGTLAKFETKKAMPPAAGSEAPKGGTPISLNSSATWTASASGIVEEKFRSSQWTKPEDVDASLSYLLMGWKGIVSINTATSVNDRLLTLRTSLGLNAQGQTRPYLYDDRTAPSTVHPYTLSDWAYRLATGELQSALSFSPLPSNSPFAASSLTYSIGGALVKYRYTGLSGSGLSALPIYTTTWWNKDSISTHAATLAIGFSPKNAPSQRLSISATLPPLLEKYSAQYSFSQKYLNATIQGAVSRASLGADVVPSSLSASISAGANPYPILKTDATWDFDARAPSSISSSLQYGWAKGTFILKKSKGYAFASGLWSTDGTEYFRPYEATVSLTPRWGEPNSSISDKAAFKFSIRPTISYSQNFVRFTESSLGATLDLSLNSSKGTSIVFSSSSVNKSAWRYWPGLFPSSSGFDPADYQKDFLTDIGEAFSIWDANSLRKSLFKLSSLSIKLAQDLHDWKLEAGLGMNPVLFTPDTGRPYYQLDFSFNFNVSWKDISELKSQVAYEKGVFTK